MEKEKKGVDNVKILREQVDAYLKASYSFLEIECRDDGLLKSREFWTKINAIDPNDGGALLGLARCAYLIDGDLERARRITQQISDPIYKGMGDYNKAFFAIKDKDEDKVLFYYQKIINNPSFNAVDIIEFLQNEFAKEGENILYHFALGYINIYHADLDVGIEELKIFIKKAEEKKIYKALILNAEALVGNREKRKQKK